MQGENVQSEQIAFELHLRGCEVKAAAFAPTPGTDRGVFSCSVSPVADGTVEELERAAHRHTPVCLRFDQSSLFLELARLERKDPQSIRIVGRVIRSNTRA
jgi:hypothetical protein